MCVLQIASLNMLANEGQLNDKKLKPMETSEYGTRTLASGDHGGAVGGNADSD